MDMSVIKTKRPKGKGWVEGPTAPVSEMFGYPSKYWFYPERKIAVISAVEVASDPGEIELGPEYHISISKNRSRCSTNEARFVLKAFDMIDADEDNHVPGGFVRNYWKPVAENLIGYVCPCKEEEPAIVEDKGDFVWRGITQ